jgi:hypothetical protein
VTATHELEALDLQLLVRDGDVHLSDLSTEQYEALWAEERIELDPAWRSVAGPALRSLAAAGMATIDPSGEVTLSGTAAIVRQAHSFFVPTLTWVADPALSLAPRLWSLLDEAVVLEQTMADPSFSSFALRAFGGALSEMCSAVMGPGDTPQGTPWMWGPDDESGTERLHRLAEQFPLTSHLGFARAVPDAIGVPTEFERWGLMLLHAQDGPGWAVEATPEGATVRPTGRVDLRRTVMAALDRSAR